MYCSKCGTKITIKGKFCGKCGTEIVKETHLSEPHPHGQKINDNYWSRLFNSRINRGNYFTGHILVVVIMMIMFYIVQLFAGGETESASIVDLLVLAFFYLYYLSLSIRRLHDLDKSGWHILGMFIPIYNVILGFQMTFSIGVEHTNAYGTTPKGNFNVKAILGLKEDDY